MNEPKEPIRNRIKKYIANHEVNERVKTHFEKHKVKYYIGATVVATTAVEVTVFTLLRKKQERATISIASANNGGHHNTIINADTINIFYKRVSKYGTPLGRPGIEILDLDTGKTYDAMKRCMADLDVTPYQLRQHLNGNLSDLNGHRLMRVDSYGKQFLGQTGI